MGYMLSSKTLTWIRKAIHHVLVFFSGLFHKTGLFCMLFSLQKQSIGFILLSTTAQITKAYCTLHLSPS